MSKLPWEARAAKREMVEAALRKALEHIKAARSTGGPTSASGGSWYRRALHLVRHAEQQLRISEEER